MTTATRPKPPSVAERLKSQCPKCFAITGEPCRDFRGEPTDKPHRDRGRPDLAVKALARKAESLNRREKETYGPLFQPVAVAEMKPVTPADLIERRRQEAAKGVESAMMTDPANAGLEWLRIRAVWRLLAERVGDAWASDAWDYCERCYRTNEGCWLSCLAELLTTDRSKALRYELRYDLARVNDVNRDGRYLVNTLVWPPPGFTPMDRAEFDRRFKIDHKHGLRDATEPDDGGLFVRTVGAMRGAA